MLRLNAIPGLILALLLGIGSYAHADGTEILGPASIEIAEGSGIAVGGVGLKEGPASIEVDVPEGAEIEQVLLYWIAEFYEQTEGDPTMLVNGVEVTGQAIGGPTLFFSVVEFESYRADITDLGLVTDGLNVLDIDGFESSFGTTGAGVVVIYDDGGPTLETELLDGLDLAYWRFEGTLLGETVPLTYTFEPADYERIGNIVLQVGSVEAMRPNVTEVTIDGVTEQYFNLFTSADGPQWDAQILPVLVPAGVNSVTVQLVSASDGTENNPASLGWVVGGLAIEKPAADDDCNDCEGKVTELSLKYKGDWGQVKVFQRVQGRHHEKLIFCDYVRRGDTFTIYGADNQGTLGPEIEIYVNGRLNARIHTSCSEPIGPGLKEGDFQVVAGVSRNGGELCPVENDDEPPRHGCWNTHNFKKYWKMYDFDGKKGGHGHDHGKGHGKGDGHDHGKGHGKGHDHHHGKGHGKGHDNDHGKGHDNDHGKGHGSSWDWGR